MKLVNKHDSSVTVTAPVIKEVVSYYGNNLIYIIQDYFPPMQFSAKDWTLIDNENSCK